MENPTNKEARVKRAVGVLPIRWFVVCILLLSASTAGHAADCAPVAKLISAQGLVESRAAQSAIWQAVKPGQTFCQGDALKTNSKGRAAVRMVNETLVRLDKGTTITFTEIAKDKPSILDLIKGVIHSISRTPRSLDIRTPFVNAAIEGTEFVIAAYKDSSRITVFEGKVVASNEAGRRTVTANQVVEAKAGQAPTEQLNVRPRDAVAWALYYPPLIETATLQPGVSPDPDNMLHEALRFYAAGDLLRAMATLDAIPGEPDIPRCLAAAAFNLSFGDVEAARQHLQKVMGMDPDNAESLAMQTIIAVVQNDLPTAAAHASRALSAGPDSAVAWVAQSYLDQAHFDIPAALQHGQRAVELAPHSAITRARLAELQLMSGLSKKAQASAHEAALANPRNARVQTVFGFASLRSVNLDAAETAFGHALEFDSAAPLPHLGLGLLKIRRNQLRAGREEIENASLLDPGNALLRSYLGKAYYEEKRSQRATDQFRLAKELDPNDPTAWFYASILLQSINRPVEALDNQLQAIEKNDNRGVYRSRQLLDQDEAARTVSLGRIYNDLGFEELARVQAVNALSGDPGNYSAHRLLADSLLGSARHDDARQSELLQAQLLQPLNLMPLQPQLNESNLGLLDGAGPGNLSYNEYNPMFIRNGLFGQINASAAENGTWGDDIVVAGLQGRLAVSLGQYHFETDGFGGNADFDKDIYNLFAQAALTDDTSLQLEFRQEEENKGSVAQRFLPGNLVDDTRRIVIKDRMSRLGLRQDFSSNAQLLISAIQHETDIQGSATLPIPAPLDVSNKGETTRDLYDALISYRLKGNLHLIAGGAYARDNGHDTLKLDVLPCPLPAAGSDCQIRKNHDREQLKAYAYLYHRPRPDLDLTYALTWTRDKRDGLNPSESMLLPRLGLNWQVNARHQMRAAAYRTLSSITTASLYRTLEPSQIAGFNQIFDERPHTGSDNYGLALDSRLSADFDAGVEVHYHDAGTPLTFSDETQDPAVRFVQDIQSETQSGSLYLNWRPAPRWGLGLRYVLEDYSQDSDNQRAGVDVLALDGVLELKTQRLPLTLSWFHPSGLTLGIDISWHDQKGRFITDEPGAIIEAGRDDFWLTDLNAAWRLPKRAGSLSFGVKNLFDRAFRFEDQGSYDTLSIERSARPSALSQERLFYGSLSLSFR